jgi:plastocyanin
MTLNRLACGHVSRITSSLAVLLIASLEASCIGGLPATSQTGKVEEIVIGAVVAPSEVTLAPGDEIRWVNRQQGPVSIIFLEPIQEQVSCERGFGLAGVANATRLAPNKGISLCFAMPGTIRYTVHLDTPTSTGEFNIPGVIHVEEGG